MPHLANVHRRVLLPRASPTRRVGEKSYGRAAESQATRHSRRTDDDDFLPATASPDTPARVVSCSATGAYPPPRPPPPVVIVQETSLPPVLQRIAQCESRGQHWTKDGQVVLGTKNPQDTGLFQINAGVWGPTAAALGYDIWTREGNEQMARYLFAHYGTVPWRSSAPCWQR